MTISDIHGFTVEIADLQLAIMQADDNRHVEYLNPELADAAIVHRAYWDDIYEKLVALQADG